MNRESERCSKGIFANEERIPNQISSVFDVFNCRRCAARDWARSLMHAVNRLVEYSRVRQTAAH